METVDRELEQVLSSRTFERAPTLRKLLLYLWEHRSDEISEYAIATEALRRRADFEPRFDATVRVLVSRLRKRLKEFYDEEGTALTTRIVIPVGTHQIQILAGEIELSADPSGAVESEKAERKSFSRLIILIQFALILLLVASTGWLLWQRNHEGDKAVQAESTRLPHFWKQFLGNGRATRIIVPNPTFFGWNNGLMARDVRVNNFAALSDSTSLVMLSKQFGKPSLAQHYVASSDAIAWLEIDRFLGSRGVQAAISTTAEISMEALDRENVIVAGNQHTLAVLPQILDRLSYQVDTSKWLVINRRPAPGEPAKFETVNESSTRIVTPGVIASLPGGPAGTHLLVLLTTYHTSALVSYLTSEAGLKELDSAQSAHGHCQYFEAVVLSEINGTTTLGSKLTAFKPYNPK